MKHRARIETLLVFAGMLFAILANAANRYWSGSGIWNTVPNTWGANSGGPYDNATWDSAAPDSAFFEGTAGTVTLGEAISISNLTISVASYKIGGSDTLTFGAGGKFTNLGNSVTISCGISGSPNIEPRQGGNQNLTFAPTAADMALGTITRPSDNYVTLGGTTTGNSLISIPKGTRNAKVRFNGSATWTVGDVYGGYVFIEDACHLIVNGTLTCDYRQIQLKGGVLHYNNPATIGPDEPFYIMGGDMDNSSGTAITNSTHNPRQEWRADWTFIGSQGTNSDLNLGAGTVTMTADRTVTVSNALTTLTLGGVVSDDGHAYSLTKAGAGALTLTGHNTYLGDTIVAEGTLTITQPYVNDITSVWITNGAVLNLDFTGTNDIFAVYTNGVKGPLGTWGPRGSGADHETALLAGKGFLNAPVPTALAGSRLWDGGTTDISGVGDQFSDGGDGTWSTAIKNWDQGAGVAYTNWNNATHDLAILAGTAGTVTLAENVNLGALFIDAAGYTITSNTLHFGPRGAITNAGDGVTIESAITGSPAVFPAQGGNKNLTFAPTTGSMALGTFDRSVGDNYVILGGTTTGNTVTAIPKGIREAKVRKNGTGTWVVDGVLYGGWINIDEGTLIANGRTYTDYRQIVLSSGATLVMNGTLEDLTFNGGRLKGTGSVETAVTVPAGATLAPGDPTGTLTITNSDCTIDGTLAVTIDGTACGTLAMDPGNTLDISNATLEVNVINSPAVGELVIATYGSGNLVGDKFRTVNGLEALKGSQPISYDYDSGTAIAIVVRSASVLVVR